MLSIGVVDVERFLRTNDVMGFYSDVILVLEAGETRPPLRDVDPPLAPRSTPQQPSSKLSLHTSHVLNGKAHPQPSQTTTHTTHTICRAPSAAQPTP